MTEQVFFSFWREIGFKYCAAQFFPGGLHNKKGIEVFVEFCPQIKLT